MNAHRYFLLSDTHREQLTKRLTSALRAWSAAWHGGSASPASEPTASITAAQEWRYSADLQWRSVKSGDKQLGWTCFPQGTAASLLDVAAGGSGSGAGELAESLGWKLVVELLTRIYGAEASRLTVETQTTSEPPASLFSVGGDGVAISIHLGTFEIRVLALGEAIKSFAPGPAARQLPTASLTPLSKAIDGQKAALKVMLEVPGGVVLDEIEDLAEGHVLMLDQAPWAEWTLLGPADVRLGRCRPGRIGDRFAIQLVTPSKT